MGCTEAGGKMLQPKQSDVEKRIQAQRAPRYAAHDPMNETVDPCVVCSKRVPDGGCRSKQQAERCPHWDL